MHILLIRHADAVRLEEGSTLREEDRPLTDRGLVQCQVLAQALLKRGVGLGKVITSPLVRAQQTADQLLLHWTEPKPELHVCQALAPEGKEKKLTRFIR